MLGHKLNIINEFTDEFKSIDNSVCKNNKSSYFLAFFYFFVFHYNYRKNISTSVYR